MLSATDADSKLKLTCPICNEDMVTLPQLNQHIDDTHSSNRSEAPHKKTINLDLYDDQMEFGLCDFSKSREDYSTVQKQLSRSHWKHPRPGKNTCSQEGCNRVLNVKNGVVNCRKCGYLYCNAHTNNSVRLVNEKNPKNLPQYSTTSEGVFARSCELCFWSKPLFNAGVPVLSRDLTLKFKEKRIKCIEDRKWTQDTIQRRFIKLVNLLALDFLWYHKHRSSFLSYINSPKSPFTKESLMESQKVIVGLDNWQQDDQVTHCPICFVQFSFFVRKHHCRLCGMIVSDSLVDINDPSSSCSLQIPAPLLMQKMPQLNYSLHVSRNWDILMTASNPESSAISDKMCFRCCKRCKDLLLQDIKPSKPKEDPTINELFASYNDLLVIKHNIALFLPKYSSLVGENKDPDNQTINSVRVRLVKYLKDFEIGTKEFRLQFFYYSTQTKTFCPVVAPPLVANIYKSIIMFLQESLLLFKRYNEIFSENEKSRLNGQLGISEQTSLSPTPGAASPSSPARPRLSKKEIRELREELMVLNEQKYLVQQQIETAKTQRRFDEIKTLIENVGELDKRIQELDKELGEFAFG